MNDFVVESTTTELPILLDICGNSTSVLQNLLHEKMKPTEGPSARNGFFRRKWTLMNSQIMVDSSGALRMFAWVQQTTEWS